MAVLPLPNGKTQFLDANGTPLAGGKAYHYVPGTTTPKTTYQDSAGSVANSNPVVLDSAGEAAIWGNGAYRQIVTDKSGTQQWDANTTTATPATIGAVALAGDTMTGTLIAPSISDTGGQQITAMPTGDAVSTITSFNVQGSTASTTTREFLACISMQADKRYGTANDSTGALLTSIVGAAGTGDIWGAKTVMTLNASSGNYDAIGQEVTVVNSVGDRGETSGSGGLATPVSYGVAITAPAGYRNTAAILVTGPGSAVFNRGIAFSGGSINQATFQDLTSAPISVEVQGAHTYGVDMASATFSGAAIRLPFGYKIKSRNGTNSADINLIQAGAGGGDATFVGDTANVAVVINNHCVPVADNTYTCGWGIGRWSAVWAVNGTIQTSDPSLKDDIAFLADLPPGTAGRLVAAISPITFRWKVGGRDADGAEIPGKRTHWGWNAAEVKSAFDAIGKDFGGYVRDENGVQHLRPDQLVPVLWQAVKDLTARVAALEAR